MRKLLLLIVLAHVQSSAAKTDCGQPADIIFIIDSSRSIWPPHFDLQKNFIKRVVRMFDVSPGRTRIGALTFSKGVSEEFALDDFETKKEVVRAIGQINFTAGDDTQTFKGLQYAREKMFKIVRDDVPKIAIILTDGRSSDPILTKQEAGKLREDGVEIFAIGIGGKVDFAELEAMASQPKEDFMHHVDRFTELDGIRTLLVHGACAVTTPAPTTPSTTTPLTTTTPTTTTTTPTTTTTTTTTPITTTVTTTTPSTTTTTTTTATTTTTTTPTTTTTQPETTTMEGANSILGDEAIKACGKKPADVIFVLDISSSIYIDDFLEQLHFVSDVVEIFDIGPERTQVAVVSFSDNATTEFYLNDFQEKMEIQKNIMGVKYTGGKTYTNKALALVIQGIMTLRHGFRKSVAHVVIVITDGMSAEPDVTSAVASKLKKKGAYVFAIGVSNNTDLPELQDIASKPSKEFVYQVNGYNALRKLKNILAKKTCNVKKPQPQGDQPKQCISGKPADLIYVTDFNGAGGSDVKRSIEMVKTTSETLQVGEDEVHVGLVSNECPDIPSIELDEYYYSDEFVKALQPSTNTPLKSLLKDTRKKLFASGSRKGANKVAVVMVNGPIDDFKGAAEEVLRAAYKHVEFVFVKAGSRANLKQLNKLSDRPVLDFESATFKRDLARRICTAVSG